MNVTNDQQVFEYLKQLASDEGINIAGAKVRRSSSRFCLGVEHGDYNGTELFGVGTDRFIWMAYKPNGTNTMRFFSGNFPDDGIVEFEIGNTPRPQSAEVYDTWARFPYGVDYILAREGYRITQGIDAVLYGNIPGGGMSRSASLALNLILSVLDANGIEKVFRLLHPYYVKQGLFREVYFLFKSENVEIRQIKERAECFQGNDGASRYIQDPQYSFSR